MKAQAFQMQRSLLARFQLVAVALSDYNAPFLVEMTNASQAGYASSYETQYWGLADQTVEKLVFEILGH